MKTSSELFRQSTNAQVALDGKKRMIVACHGGWRGATDQGRLLPMADSTAATGGRMPAKALADAGYCNEAELDALEARGIVGHVALGREGRKHAAIDRDRRPATHRREEHLATPQGRAGCAERKWLSESPNGWIKEVLGFRPFHVHGRKKVQGEWSLVCLALNIRRMSGLTTA